MSPCRIVVAFFLSCVVPGLRAADAEASDAGSFEATRGRITALFRGRDSIPLLPADLRNPFSRVDERSPLAGKEPTGTGTTAHPPLSDRALLERVAAAIQIRGFVETGGHPTLIINRKAFGEGDMLTVLYGDVPLEIFIKRISSETFTLGYKDIELTLRLPR